MYIFSKNLLLQSLHTQGKEIFASDEALQAMLEVGSAIKINDGMGEDIYRYTAYPITTTKTGDFTYTSYISKIKNKHGDTIYYADFDVPTNSVTLEGNVHYYAYKNGDSILYVAPNEKDGVVYDSNLTALNPQPTYEEGGVTHTGANITPGVFELQSAATKVGTPTEVNGVYSNISDANYVRTTDNFNPGNSPWEFCFMFNLDSFNGRLFGAQYDYFMDCQFYENNLQILMSYGGGWDNALVTTNGFLLGVDYWLKFGYTGSNYYAKYSTEGIDGPYIDCGNLEVSSPLRSGMGFISFGTIAGHGYAHMYGKLGFNGAYYKIGDTTYLLGATSSTTLEVDNVVYEASPEDDAYSSTVTIDNFADQDNADVNISVNQDNLNISTDAGVETATSIIEGCRNCYFDNLSGYTNVKIESGGEIHNTGNDFLVNDNQIVSCAQVYNNKIVNYEQIIAKQDIIRRSHNFNIKVFETATATIASNFSDSYYVVINPTIPASFTDIDIIIRAMYNGSGFHNNLFARAYNWFGVRNNGIASMYLQQWIQGQTAITPGVDYFYRLKSDGNGNFVFYTLLAGDYTIDTLPDLSQWTVECSTTNNWLAGQQFYFSYNSGSTSEFWRYGSINLYESSIYVDGDVLFDGSDSSDWTNHNATLTQEIVKGKEIHDATVKIYGATTSAIDAYSNQKIDYEVSKSGCESVGDTYTIPINNTDNKSYSVDVLLYPGLPSGYTRLQYIETSNKNSWINTGVKSSTDDVYKFTFSANSVPISDYGDYTAVFGNGDQDVDFFYTAATAYGYDKWQAVWGNQTVDVPAVSQLNTWYNIILQNGSISVNGATTSFTQTTVPGTRDIYIGRVNHQNSSLTMYFDGKLKEFSITRSGSLFRNYIPAKYDLGGGSYSVGYYETITQTFLTSSGDYPFIAGPDYE